MSAINTITVSGNLTADPELRRTGSEVPYAKMRIAVSRRVLNGETKAWEDRQDGFFNVTAWRDLARHAVTSLQRGDRITVTGRMMRRAYTVDGENGQSETRHVHEIEAEDLGPSLRWQAWTRLQPRPTQHDDAEATDQASTDQASTDRASTDQASTKLDGESAEEDVTQAA